MELGYGQYKVIKKKLRKAFRPIVVVVAVDGFYAEINEGLCLSFVT